MQRILLRNIARMALGPSTWRAIPWAGNGITNERKDILHKTITNYLAVKLDLQWFRGLPSDHDAILAEVTQKAKRLASKMQKGRRLTASEIFGYAAKAIALYMRGVIEHRGLLDEATAIRLRPFCPIAIDKYIFDRMRKVGLVPPKTVIRHYTAKTWIQLQISIRDYCNTTKPPIHPADFDYIAWTEGAT